jgi:hypothetical protein
MHTVTAIMGMAGVTRVHKGLKDRHMDIKWRKHI